MGKHKMMQGCGCSLITMGIIAILMAVVLVVSVSIADEEAGERNQAEWKEYSEQIAVIDSLNADTLNGDTLSIDTIQAPPIRQGGFATLFGALMALVICAVALIPISIGAYLLHRRKKIIRIEQGDNTSQLTIIVLLLSLGTCSTFLTSCSSLQDLSEQNSVYYWRTDLRLDSLERNFLGRYNINKVYSRYFDVVMRDGQPMPNATITFSDSLPEGIEMIPTVYITPDVFTGSKADGDEQLAERLMKRILQMNETNDIHDVREIQIDYDYTSNTRQRYYAFLENLRNRLLNHGLNLSTTIRLHQLAMPIPPVDYGVLMIYNTGDPRKFAERNPVLDERDVQPYIRYLNDYELPLAAAYPVYLWQRRIHGVHIEHKVEADVLLRVKETIEKARSNMSRQIITYHLSEENIKRYKPETYEAIYQH